VFKCPKLLYQGSLPAEQSLRLDQRQPVFDVSYPVQNNEEQLVVYVEMNPLLPDSPQQNVIFLFEQRVFRMALMTGRSGRRDGVGWPRTLSCLL
jgi:hypothetical protein